MFNDIKRNARSASPATTFRPESSARPVSHFQLLKRWIQALWQIEPSSRGESPRPANRNWTKYLLDLLLILFALPTLLPLFGVVAILIKLDSPGPIFHRRRVLGLSGRQFDALKFRTMYVNGEEILNQYPFLRTELDPNGKLKQDPRITPTGIILRKLSLDELPQLINVLFGQMSLVGPRMISPEEMVKYGEDGPKLLSVMPGLTGLWQVSGRSDLSCQERIQLDLVYIRDYSLSLDLDILFLRTLPAVLKGEGVY